MKISKIILALMLVLCLTVSMIACNGAGGADIEGKATDPKGTEPQTTGTDKPDAEDPDEEPGNECTSHVDANPKDAKCDVCGTAVPCTACADSAPKDGKCDVCGNNVTCEHTYADTYTSDETHHWKAATCGCTVEPKDKAAHADTAPKDGKCDVCGKAVACATCVDVAPKDAKCDVCGKEVPCVTCVDNANGIKDATCDICGKDVVHDTIDASFEDEFKSFLQAQGSSIKLTQTSSTSYVVSAGGTNMPMRTESKIVQNVKDGKTSQLQLTDTYITMAPGPEMLFSSSGTKVINIGNTFYVTSTQKMIGDGPNEYDTVELKFLIAATQQEIDDLNGQLTQDVDTSVDYSVNHFKAINVSIDGDGNTVYTCYKLRTDVGGIYDQLCENMFSTVSGDDADFAMDPNSFEYVLVVSEEGKLLSSNLKMDIALKLDMGGTNVETVYHMSALQEYDYEPEDVTAPVTDSTWINMTMTEYIGMAQGVRCQNTPCADNNDNKFCDACGTLLRCLNGCTDGRDIYQGLCDVCRQPVA